MRLPVRALTAVLQDAVGRQEGRDLIAIVGVRVGQAADDAGGTARERAT